MVIDDPRLFNFRNASCIMAALLPILPPRARKTDLVERALLLIPLIDIENMNAVTFL